MPAGPAAVVQPVVIQDALARLVSWAIVECLFAEDVLATFHFSRQVLFADPSRLRFTISQIPSSITHKSSSTAVAPRLAPYSSAAHSTAFGVRQRWEETAPFARLAQKRVGTTTESSLERAGLSNPEEPPAAYTLTRLHDVAQLLLRPPKRTPRRVRRNAPLLFPHLLRTLRKTQERG